MEENKMQQVLEVSDGSYMEFYKNGVLQERKFVDIYEGTYHAAVSLYMHGRCKVNFGKCPFSYQPRSSSDQAIIDEDAQNAASVSIGSRVWLPYSMLSDVVDATHPQNLAAAGD